MTPEQLFREQLPLIERVIASVCRRNGCYGGDAEDFEQTVKLKLIEEEYAVLGKFEGKSRLDTYLMVVVNRSFLDFQNHRWGKWRPSARARQLGPIAVRLDILWNRDRLSLEEAIETLRTNREMKQSPEELEDIAVQLPRHPPRRFEGEDSLENVGSPGGAEQRVTDSEMAATVQRIELGLEAALQDFSGEDRLLLELHYWSGFTWAQIARKMRLDQRRLYSLTYAWKGRFRASLEAAGITAEQVTSIVGWEKSELRIDPAPLEPRNPPDASVSREGGE